MATIDSVKLPDNSTYDLADNYSGYQTETLATPITINGVQETTVEDALDGLNDYGDALADNIAANENIYGAKNLWNIEKWLNDIGQAFTKSGDVYTTTISDARTNTNKCVFSDTDIEVTLSAELTASGSTQFYVELFNSNDQNVGSISLSNPTFTGVGCKVRFNFNNTGTVTLTAPMIRDARILDPTFVPFAETNLQLTRKTSGLSNENLLDNAWFTVNQREFTSATASSIPLGFMVDRWKSYYESSGGAGVTSKTTNGLHFQPVGGTNGSLRLMQTSVDPSVYSGKTLTLSVLYAKGNSTNFEYFSGTLTNFDPSVGGHFFYVSDNGYITAQYVPAYTSFMLVIAQECTIKAVKVELGSISTLANDVEPNYTTELLKCQRYFFRLKANSNYTTFGFGFCTIADQLALPINLPVAMRPISAVNYVGNLRAYILGGSNKTVSAITSAASQVENMKLVYFTATGLTAGDICYLISENDSSAYIDLSAEL